MTRLTHLKLVGPGLIIAAVLILGLAAIPYFGIQRIDAEHRARQEELVKRNISIWIADLEFALTAWTIWDESISKIDNSFDLEWTERNIGSSLIGTSRTRFVSIVDSDGRLIYTKMADEVAERPFFQRGAATIVEDASGLIQQVRQTELRPRSSGIPSPIAVSKMEVIGADAVLLTASLFQSDFGLAKPVGATAPVMISAVPIAGSLQEFMGNRFLLDDPTLGTLDNANPDRARVEIAIDPGGQTQALSWRAATPARDTLVQSLPLIGVVVILLTLAAVFAIRVSRHALTALIRSEEQMRHAATHDFLTGLPNRSLIATDFARLSPTRDLIVACIDLDGFKGVNDTHGHAVGDELLKQVSRRLRNESRKQDQIYRLSGDEFAILMPALSLREAESRCRNISANLSQVYHIDEREVVVGASFGLSFIASGDSVNCDEAFRRADAALYDAKRAGRGLVSVSNHGYQRIHAAAKIHPPTTFDAVRGH